MNDYIFIFVCVSNLLLSLFSQGDKSELSDLDQFLLGLMQVPNLKTRLDLLLTVYELPLQVLWVVFCMLVDVSVFPPKRL